jgi:DNA-binding Xre family transcriptional regulator
MKAIINIGLLLQKIREKNCHGFSDASALCRTSPKNFVKLSKGELPRLDALQRICRGLGISEQDLIVGMPKSKPAEPAEVVELRKTL